MLIIKKYGRSITEIKENKLQRTLRLTDKPTISEDIPIFVKKYADLLISQWISIIDKVINPTKGTNYRKNLGDACWKQIFKHVEDTEYTKEIKEKLKKALAELKPIWTSKVDDKLVTDNKKGKNTNTNTNKISIGRLYHYFAKGTENVDMDAIAKGIYKYLHCDYSYRVEGYPNKPKPSQQPMGLIDIRAKSIVNNILHKRVPPAVDFSTNSDEVKACKEKYKEKGNIAEAISNHYDKYLENKDSKDYKTRVSYKTFQVQVMKELYKHYEVVFGKNTSIKDAQAQQDGLFILHEAVKSVYKQLLEKVRNNNNKKYNIVYFPTTMPELYTLIYNKTSNKEVSSRIKEGKIIHYSANNKQDKLNWQNSAKQIEIKRSEAFVRIWRRVISHAQRTLTDLAIPDIKNKEDKGQYPDILNYNYTYPTDEQIISNICKKAELLYGTEDITKDNLKIIVEGLIQQLKKLRNNAFHFKKLTGFKNALILQDTNNQDTDYNNIIQQIWNKDSIAQQSLLVTEMESVGCHFYLKDTQIDLLYKFLQQETNVVLALPKFRNMLERANNAWNKGQWKVNFPKVVNMTDLNKNDEHRCQYRCQYVMLKFIYEEPFRQYCASVSKEVLQHTIKQVFDRTTEEAKRININKKDIAQAKAMQILKIENITDLDEFNEAISAAMASSMNQQKKYGLSPEDAREESSYVQDLKQDVSILLFNQYLTNNNLTFLLNLKEQLPPREQDISKQKLESLAKIPPKSNSAELWQQKLYFLLYLVPVEEVNSLWQQVQKWHTSLEKSTDNQKDEKAEDKKLSNKKNTDEDEGKIQQSVQQVFKLYTQMNDTKNKPKTLEESKKDLLVCFESEEALKKVASDDTAEHILPLKGLRDMLRFGDMKPLENIFKSIPIKYKDVEKWLKQNNTIKDAQDIKTNLHKKLVQEKPTYANDVDKYKEAVKTIEKHKHLQHHVLMVNHKRLHHLLMNIMGRLIDYIGLFERDVYFYTLTFINQQDRAKFSKEILGCNIFGVIDNIEKEEREEGTSKTITEIGINKDIITKIKQKFYGIDKKTQQPININFRNSMAHFSILYNNNNNEINITKWVNKTRALFTYDRKLKNAVSKSIIDMLQQEGLKLTWKMDAKHQLCDATIATDTIKHLSKVKVSQQKVNLLENKHGEEFIKMVQQLF